MSVIQELKKNPDPEPITRPELHTNKKETQFSPQEKSSRFLFQCELCNVSFEHEQNFHVHKWVHEFKKVPSSVFLNDFDGLSTKPMIEMPPQIEFKLPNEEPEEIEPEKRIVTFSDGNCVIDPETGKLTKIIKTFQSVTPPMIDVPSLFESKLPKEEPEEMEQEEREENLTFHNRFLDPETGNLIKIEEPEKSPEPECQPEPKPSVRPVMVEDEIKLVADDPMVKYDSLNNDDNMLVCDICLIRFDSINGLKNHSAQECENEISWLFEKQEKWKKLSRDLFENLPEDFVSEFFSELPIIIDCGNSKAMQLSCDLCSMAFDSNESLINHRTKFCKSEISSMRENKFLWKRLTIDLSMNLPEDFFLDFISGLFTEANASENDPAPKVKPNKESPSKKELNKSGEILDAFSEKYEKNNETTSHSCLSCDKFFLSYKKMKAHMVRNHENGNYKCSMCNSGFSMVLNLNKHIEKEHPASLSCLLCNKNFLSYKKMKAHMVRSHENGNFKCSTCNIGFSSVLKLKKHVEKEHPASHSCLLCNKKFRSNDMLRAHNVRSHENGALKCSMCNAGFTIANNLKKHIEKEHPTSQSCLLCNKIFFSYEGVKAHIVKSHDNGTYKCSMCNAGFSLVLNLKNHIEKEHGNEESPYGSKILNTSSKGRNEIKLQADIMSTAKVAHDVHEIIPENCKLQTINSRHENLSEANMSILETDINKSKPCPKIDQELKQIHEQKNIANVNLDKEKLKEFDENMDFFENMELDETMEYNRDMEFDNIEDEDTIDALESAKAMNIVAKDSESENLSNQCEPEEDYLLNSQEHLIGTKVSMDNKNDETLEVHEDSAVKNQNHKCEYCFKTFAGDISLKGHLLKSCKSNPNNNNCMACGQKFSKRSNLNRHVSKNKCPGKKTSSVESDKKVENKNCECKNCFKTFTKISHLDRHLLYSCKKLNYPKTVPNKRYSTRLGSAETLHQCSKCSLFFTKKSHLIHHHNEEHELKGIKKMYKCKYCEKIINHRYKLKIHFQKTCTSDPDRFELIPEMRIEDETSLKKEVRSRKIALEDLEKTYICKYCKQTFVRLSNLRKHLKQVCTSDPNRFELVPQMKIEKIYECSMCDRPFLTKQVRDIHISSIHEGKKPFLCSQCGFSSALSGLLKRHIESVHEGKRPYQCNQCNKNYKSKHGLEDHISAFHERNKPFKCSVCSRSFPTNTKLKEHGDVHTNIRPYSCTICEDKFKRSHHLVTHLKTIHNVTKKDCKI